MAEEIVKEEKVIEEKQEEEDKKIEDLLNSNPHENVEQKPNTNTHFFQLLFNESTPVEIKKKLIME